MLVSEAMPVLYTPFYLATTAFVLIIWHFNKKNTKKK